MQRPNYVPPKVELSFSCTKLVNLDTVSKTDPSVTIYLGDFAGSWKEIGKTERIKDNLNPKFLKTVIVDYYFESIQHMKFVVLDGDATSEETVGYAETTLSAIMGSRGNVSIPLQHRKRKHSGFINIVAEEIREGLNYEVLFNLCGKHLDKKDLFGKSDPYLELSRVTEDGKWIMFHRTEVVKNTLDPIWLSFTIPLAKVNGGDNERPIRVQCYDWDKVGSPDFIGEYTASLNQMIQTPDWVLMNPKKSSKKNYKGSGVISGKIQIIKIPTFIEYLQGGLQISLMVAIDYTLSNGEKNMRESLHYMVGSSILSRENLFFGRTVIKVELFDSLEINHRTRQ
eukprot:TRINITY_DN6133_c0_g1_i1.p1 TRINITY_DN6133_c0_g1~~TRINITY_DN6133_c0_g1_i1.p1  ORF type:complete len:340 (-),score=54.09 TRINITY_DN6133_c0_g1_i1:758-1777(-)